MKYYLYKYKVKEYDCTYQVRSAWLSDDAEYIASEAAEDAYSFHDGWEWAWPVNIEVFEDNESLGVFEVNLELEPVFSAEEV